MESTVIIVSLIALTGLAIATFIILKKLQEMKELQLVSQNDKLISQLNDNLQGVQKLVDQNMQGMRQSVDKTTESLNERLDNAAKIIGSLKQEMGSMKEIGRSISDFQAFLKSPKLRGNLGEQLLYDTLNQVFSSEQCVHQYKFKDGQTVDAILKTSAGIIPIDSKFPMEAYQRYIATDDKKEESLAHREFTNAVRKHIRDISTKYILPQEGTVNFAVIYIPSESVYYEVTMQHEELNTYAQQSNVMVTSPNTFFNFLHVVMMGMERNKLQEQAQQIWEILKGVQKETEKFGEKLSVLNRHVTNAKSAMETVSGEYTKLSSKVDQVKLLQ
ncbi:hypothetical protein COV06_02975 [Candidatus Uhrbacteria bacterium CG10_big_fil_rev_8_21_14_0_10_50_16]|uniref:DNA recombination protein RmuC n=1 Tax=Candidatus Uhrbacteria bacterium CG10_big_fil_rev_8_21_14_0_10_50_16 TaxID=1975039 RepID=A0A2H0RLM3_9BACT|nr:MAG: hypothetical protein COV06_02975 [Candidatus Uhrbacteria bacterium CG10_big_fil_rev_8_21_14_0_10_50_16]